MFPRWTTPPPSQAIGNHLPIDAIQEFQHACEPQLILAGSRVNQLASD